MSHSANTIHDVMPVAVMGTNDNCTVSKRSVESLYYDKPHFYRYFVKKFKKRTALINRGYLLRMRAVEHELKIFLSRTAGRKIVVNLGCGYDALPFRTMSCFPDLCQAATFVDVDYESLIQEKVAIIRQNTELSALLQVVNPTKQETLVMLRSDNYLAVGCDLSRSEALQDLLAKEYGNEVSLFIISEVSITYMPVETADALLSWMSRLKNAKFCLLEQCLPNGPNHPFASTMLKHFQKLSSPLRVIRRYQTIEDQRNRFRSHGWTNIKADSLWDIWRAGQVFNPVERLGLRSIEIFDEHEEFALFATHYFLLTASSSGPDTTPHPVYRPVDEGPYLKKFSDITPKLSPRRDGVVFEAPNQVLVYHGGDDGRSRLATMQIYVNSDQSEAKIDVQQGEIPPRKYHTITRLNSRNDYLLVGGRDSPNKGLQDCWIMTDGQWTRVEDLPIPLFRHSAVLVPGTDENGSHDQPGVVVFGGKTRHDQDSDVWLLWRATEGWRTLVVETNIVSPRFSANLLYLESKRVGILLGGMISSEVIANGVFTWTINGDTISIVKADTDGFYGNNQRVFRFGAVLIEYPDVLLLLGGIAEEGLPQVDPDSCGDILALFFDTTQEKALLKGKSHRISIIDSPNIRQPLLIGHSAVVQNNMVHIVGGGAICFSFGSFMNSTSWHITRAEDMSFDIRSGLWKQVDKLALRGPTVTEAQADVGAGKDDIEQRLDESIGDNKKETTSGFIAVNRIRPDVKETLNRRIAKRKPCIFEAVDLGSCTRRWTSEYLKQILSTDRLFDIHHAKSDTMLFESKNFEIQKERFSDFMDAIASGEKRYLRAVSLLDKHKPANFYADFEALAADFSLPEHLAIPEEQQHSSVFRVSGAINMWLHYDTLSNILCQIRGSKRLLLFAPADVAHLKIPPGRSSSDLNVFDVQVWEKTSLKHTHPYEAILRPGDVLYIPPLWCHAALPLDGISIAINTFFKTADDQSYAPGKDTYGNKDISEYEYARKDIAKAMGRFSTMPKDTQRFYLERLADEMLQQAKKKNGMKD